jgi:hypothetical protein
LVNGRHSFVITGVKDQVSGVRREERRSGNLKSQMNIYLDRIYRIYFGLVFLYPVHPGDPVRKR